MNELKFNVTARQTRPVVIEDEQGQRKEYELREISVSAREKYMSAMANRMRYDDKGAPVGWKSFEGSYADLLTLCMYRKTVKEGATEPQYAAVTSKEIDSWGITPAKQIFQAAQELNKLGDFAEALATAEDAAKNE